MEGSGRSKSVDEIFCPSCGEPIKKEAVICVKCGVAVQNMQPMMTYAGAKDKTVAILLAVFLGLWTWLYTYDQDAQKFWINLAISVVTCGAWGFGAWIWAIIDVAGRPESFYKNYAQLPPPQR